MLCAAGTLCPYIALRSPAMRAAMPCLTLRPAALCCALDHPAPLTCRRLAWPEAARSLRSHQPPSISPMLTTSTCAAGSRNVF